jgi:hypothetical protein
MALHPEGQRQVEGQDWLQMAGAVQNWAVVQQARPVEQKPSKMMAGRSNRVEVQNRKRAVVAEDQSWLQMRQLADQSSVQTLVEGQRWGQMVVGQE